MSLASQGLGVALLATFYHNATFIRDAIGHLAGMNRRIAHGRARPADPELLSRWNSFREIITGDAHLNIPPPSCPLCNGQGKPHHKATDENRQISNLYFSYLACRDCDTLYLADPPDNLGRYYQGEYYAIPTLEKLASVARKDTNKIDLIRRFKTSGRLLEIGPAFGVFAWQCKEAGFQVEAVEMDPACCDYLNGSLGIPTTRSSQPEVDLLGMQRHEVIALWQLTAHSKQYADTVIGYSAPVPESRGQNPLV